jgi:GNAT superfamily N-acetyltransferase
MTPITVREARPGDGTALSRIHRDMALYYAALAPGHCQVPMLDGFADELDAQVDRSDGSTLHLVAETDDEVVGALVARLLRPEAGALREITADLGYTRLKIDYVATDETHRREGVATRLVSAAENWGRAAGATIAETSTYSRSPLSLPFWENLMGYETRTANLRKPL